MKMNKLETQMIVENTGNYDEEDIEYIMDIYNELVKHIGFEDKRKDKRFVVKFHDVFYYTPEGIDEETFNTWFEDFCRWEYDYILDQAKEKNIDIDGMLTRMNVGHYQAFVVDIPEITEENAVDLAMEIYDELPYEKEKYVKNYIEVVNMLQDLEDNYMEEWMAALEANEVLPQDKIDEMRKRYNEDRERRKAK